MEEQELSEKNYSEDELCSTSEPMPTLSPEFLEQTTAPEQISVASTEFYNLLKDEEEEAIKTEPEETSLLDLYPEVSIKEELEIRPQDPVKSNDDDSRENLQEYLNHAKGYPRKEFISRGLIDSLIEQFEGGLSESEVERSVTCFVPIIPIERTETENNSYVEKENYFTTRRKARPKSVLRKRFSGRSRGRPRKITTETERNGSRVKSKLEKCQTISTCNQCSKKFKNEAALAKHNKLIELDDISFDTICVDCQLDLKHPNCLRYHRRKVHGDESQTQQIESLRCMEEIQQSNKLETGSTTELEKSAEEANHACKICSKSFPRATTLLYHLRQVHNVKTSKERKFACHKCDKTFLQQTHLNVHLKSHDIKERDANEGESEDEDVNPKEDADPDYVARRSTGSKIPTCEVCGKVFTRTTGLMYHRSQVHHLGNSIERKFSCSQCDKTFLKKSHLILHGQSHSGERLFQCRFCLRSFGGTTGRRLHEEKVHGKSGAGLTDEQIEQNRAEAALKGDQDTPAPPKPRVRSEGKQFPCSYCSKVFIRPSMKRVHERSHTGEKPFLCMICGNSYKSSIALKEHEKTSHTKTLDLLCTICGAAFGRQMSLKYHLIAKHGDKKFKCDFEGCGRSFVQRAKLERHQRIHSRGHSQCHLCNRTLETAELLERHLKIHELRKLKLAGVQGIVVPRNKTYPRKKPPPKPRKERKTPAPIRKLQCNYCEKRFPYANELDKHEKAVHLDQRDFKCPVEGCTKAFITNYKLLIHRKNRHGHTIDIDFLGDVACDICGKVCQGPARLAIHKNCRHGDGSNSLGKPRPRVINSAPRKRRTKSTVDLTEIQNMVAVTPTPPPIRATPDAIMNLQRQNPVHVPTSAAPPPQPLAYPTPPQRQSAQTMPRTYPRQIIPDPMQMTNHNLQHHQHHQSPQSIRENTYATPQFHSPDQIPFFNFNAGYNTISNFPYSTSTHHRISQFHQNHFDFPNSSNFWQAHQNHHTNRPQPLPHHYQPQIPQAHSRGERDDYASSDYSDLIHIHLASEGDQQDYQHEADYNTDDNDNYSTSNIDEEYQPEPDQEGKDEQAEQEQPKRKRGRPPKDPLAPPRPKGIPKKRAPPAGEKKTRKPLPKKELPCPICSKICGTNQHLRSHLKTHERQEKRMSEEYRCHVCNKTFNRPYFLRVHSVIHDPTLRPFKCNEPGCALSFRAPADFRKHKDQHSTKKEKEYKCKICREVFKVSGDLHSHTIEQHLDKMHACKHPGCNFLALTMGRMNRHSDQHKDKGERLRPYKCTLCDVTYIRGENLQQHMDTAHNGAGTAGSKGPEWVTCPKCPKQFDYAWKLKTHLRKTHGGKGRKPNWIPRGTKPIFYFCEDCDWTFGDSSGLRYHKKTKHKGMSQILCIRQPCDKKYFYVNTLENHMKSQHGVLTTAEVVELQRLRGIYPSEAPKVEQETSRRKSGRKSTTPRKKQRIEIIEEEESDMESIYSDEDDEFPLDFQSESTRLLPRRNSRKTTMNQGYFESSEEDD